MPNAWDASLKQLYAADKGTSFVADTVADGAAFDLVMDIEIGENLNENVDQLDLYVGVRNITRSSSVLTKSYNQKLTPKNNQAAFYQVRVPIDSTWSANEGDLLEAVATLKVTARVNTAFSYAQSDRIIVAS